MSDRTVAPNPADVDAVIQKVRFGSLFVAFSKT